MAYTIDLAGKVALVTGASQGIGAEIARTLHRAGAFVVLNHPDAANGATRRDADALVADLNASRSKSAEAAAADVRDAAGVAAMMRGVQARHGGLDILVNNAGILRDRTIAKMSAAEWGDVIDVNLTGVFHGSKFGVEVLRDGGSVVNLGSLSAEAGFAGQANYAAAKAGVQALTRVLSREVARRGIRVNAVAPGLIDSPMVAQIAPPARERLAAAIPFGRLGRPEEVASTVLFLCSDLASYISGAVIEVNGGWRG